MSRWAAVAAGIAATLAGLCACAPAGAAPTATRPQQVTVVTPPPTSDPPPPPTEPPDDPPSTRPPTTRTPTTRSPSTTEPPPEEDTTTTARTTPPTTTGRTATTRGRAATTEVPATTTTFLLPGDVNRPRLNVSTTIPLTLPSDDLPGWTTALFWVGVGGATAIVGGQWVRTNRRFRRR